MSRETDEHVCWRNANWNVDETTAPDPVKGTCQVCGEDMEHYCDDHVPRDGDLELVHHEDHTDIPIYAIRYDCPACGRELEMRLKKEGTFDRNTGRMVYGP